MTSANFWDFWTPSLVPTPCPHFTQPISTVCPQNLEISKPRLPPQCERPLWMVPYAILLAQYKEIGVMFSDVKYICFRWRALPCARTCATAIHRATISLGVRESIQSSGNSASYSQDVDSRDGLAQTVTQDWGENIVPSRALRCGGAFNLDFRKLPWFKCSPFRGVV